MQDVMAFLEVSTFLNARHYVVLGGRQGPVHPHAWRLQAEVAIALERLGDEGVGIGYAEMEQMLRRVLAPFEGTLLNDVAPFDRFQPSTENMARVLFDLVAREAAAAGVHLVALSLWESPNKGVTLRRTPFADVAPLAAAASLVAASLVAAAPGAAAMPGLAAPAAASPGPAPPGALVRPLARFLALFLALVALVGLRLVLTGLPAAGVPFGRVAATAAGAAGWLGLVPLLGARAAAVASLAWALLPPAWNALASPDPAGVAAVAAAPWLLVLLTGGGAGRPAGVRLLLAAGAALAAAAAALAALLGTWPHVLDNPLLAPDAVPLPDAGWLLGPGWAGPAPAGWLPLVPLLGGGVALWRWRWLSPPARDLGLLALGGGVLGLWLAPAYLLPLAAAAGLAAATAAFRGGAAGGPGWRTALPALAVLAAGALPGPWWVTPPLTALPAGGPAGERLALLGAGPGERAVALLTAGAAAPLAPGDGQVVPGGRAALATLSRAWAEGRYAFLADRLLELGVTDLLAPAAAVAGEAGHALAAAGYGRQTPAGDWTWLSRDPDPRAALTTYPALAIGPGAPGWALVYPAVAAGASPDLEDYPLEELARHRTVILTGARWRQPGFAAARVQQLVAAGVQVLVDPTHPPSGPLSHGTDFPGAILATPGQADLPGLVPGAPPPRRLLPLHRLPAGPGETRLLVEVPAGVDEAAELVLPVGARPGLAADVDGLRVPRASRHGLVRLPAVPGAHIVRLVAARALW